MTQHFNKGHILKCSIKDEEDLRSRCVVNEETGCWEYPGKAPIRLYVRLSGTDKGRVMQGARAALTIRDGEDRGSAYRVKCQNHNCVNPDHCKWMTKKQFGAWQAKSGLWKGRPENIISNTKAARAKARLNPEIVREIRQSPENNSEIGRRLGIGHTTISAVRRGLIWRDSTLPNSSVFSWRPA